MIVKTKNIFYFLKMLYQSDQSDQKLDNAISNSSTFFPKKADDTASRNIFCRTISLFWKKIKKYVYKIDQQLQELEKHVKSGLTPKFAKKFETKVRVVHFKGSMRKALLINPWIVAWIIESCFLSISRLFL